MHLVLASASPRRQELLAAAGFTFDVMPAHVDERARPDEAPEAYARRVAVDKAATVRGRTGGGTNDIPILSADTIVVVDGQIFGKPVDDADAARMLRDLSDRAHDVLTAIALWWPGEPAPDVSVERTRVWMRALSEAEISAAIATGEPRDKAGAYAIQGLASRWITRIDGAPGTVIGLPVEAVDRLWRLRGTGC